MEIDDERRELAIKLVYCGPARSGKTTNLQKLHARAAPHGRGRLLTLHTPEDHTLFFELLPLHLHPDGGAVVKLRVYTVPGQSSHEATRRVVFQGADGLAFVADSRAAQAAAANDAFAGVRQSLRESGLDPDRVPLVVQWNKRDLPDLRTGDDLGLDERGTPVFTACAARDEGVLPTFLGLCGATWDDLDTRHRIADRLGLPAPGFLRAVAGLFGKHL